MVEKPPLEPGNVMPNHRRRPEGWRPAKPAATPEKLKEVWSIENNFLAPYRGDDRSIDSDRLFNADRPDGH